jgi:large subunit ribosomal protein L25
MQTLEIIGYKRANLGKRGAKDLRNESNVPCVLYGGTEQVHFYTPMILFRELLYTPNIYEVHLNVEGDEYKCILQDAQFHPVNDIIYHVDFLQLNEEKEIKMEVPVRYTGVAPGVQKGGKLVSKLRKIKVKALPANMPDYIDVDVSELDLGKSVKVKDIVANNYVLINNPSTPVVSIEVPRAMRGKTE